MSISLHQIIQVPLYPISVLGIKFALSHLSPYLHFTALVILHTINILTLCRELMLLNHFRALGIFF